MQDDYFTIHMVPLMDIKVVNNITIQGGILNVKEITTGAININSKYIGRSVKKVLINN